MAIIAKFDAKAKKIKIEIDFDPAKKYPDSKSGKAKTIGNNGWGSPVDDGPENLRVGINAYLMNKKPEKKEEPTEGVKKEKK
jgi:hypothetical protein